MNVIRARGNVTRMTEYFISANSSMLAVFKLLVTWYHSKTLRSLIASIVTDWITSTSNWERNTMMKIAKRGRNLSFTCWMSAASMSIFFITFYSMHFFKTIHQPQRHLIYRLENIQKSPAYEISFVFQLIGAISSVMANYTVDNFVSILVLHVCAQLINLRTTLNNLINELANKSISSSIFKEDTNNKSLTYNT
ncbi:PREDICTED: uncharacterized protein LOC105451922 [Wasmannia auropunctata]|uniref:uncharacterized protein LOC105451922 n=1 Tax=Wasmannia auropunctata TaxID=64793 RepID=UPI0005EE711D|nr:PREDICTED: uncharacterized protein LOC105451922 [Wasmannia auropunctata]